MRFAFTDDQLAFRDAVRDLLEKVVTVPRLFFGGMHCFTPDERTARCIPASANTAQ